MKASTRDNVIAPKKRPSEVGTLVGVRLQKHELEKLDTWRAKQKDLPNRPEALRRILGLFIQRSGIISEPVGPATEILKMMDAAIEEHSKKPRIKK